jgi:hypothetical protein
MKRLKDTSMFSGIKQLKELRLVRRWSYWDVFSLSDNSYQFKGILTRTSRETNYGLYEAAQQMIRRIDRLATNNRKD